MSDLRRTDDLDRYVPHDGELMTRKQIEAYIQAAVRQAMLDDPYSTCRMFHGKDGKTRVISDTGRIIQTFKTPTGEDTTEVIHATDRWSLLHYLCAIVVVAATAIGLYLCGILIGRWLYA